MSLCTGDREEVDNGYEGYKYSLWGPLSGEDEIEVCVSNSGVCGVCYL